MTVVPRQSGFAHIVRPTARALSVLFARAARKGKSTECALSVHGARNAPRRVRAQCAEIVRAWRAESVRAWRAEGARAQRALSVLYARAARKGGVY